MRQALLALILLSGFGFSAVPVQSQPTIARLEMRDRVVTIESGEQGTLYTVSTKDGKIVDAKLNEQQLQAKHPQIYDAVQPAIADPELSPWAGM